MSRPIFAAGSLAALAANWLAAVPWRRAASAHWTERARLLWPIRVGVGMNRLLLPVFFGGIQFAFDGAFSAKCMAAAIAG